MFTHPIRQPENRFPNTVLQQAKMTTIPVECMRLPTPRLATFHAMPQSHAPVYCFFRLPQPP
ncbi:hypothetical protein [Kingella oralis]|uniref:hypothetical protein n=1 Tax=Kingella oralis TaxID=505 RepID=UPI002D7E5FA4|nr:hypothetical protein [Kingella oralis]